MNRLIPVRLRAVLLGAAVLLFASVTAHAAGNELKILPTGIEGPDPLAWRPFLMIGLVLLILVLSKSLSGLVFEPLVEVLEERDKRIAGSRTRAADLARDAGALLERYEVAVRETRERAGAERRDRIDEARRSYQDAIAASRESAEAEVGRARAEVGDAVAAARTILEQDARSLARGLAERLLGRNLA